MRPKVDVLRTLNAMPRSLHCILKQEDHGKALTKELIR